MEKTPGQRNSMNMLEKAAKYHDDVKIIIKDLDDSIGDKMRGVFLSQDSVGGDAIEINQKLEAAAAQLSEIGELNVSREELYDLMQERLGLARQSEPTA